MPEMSGFEVCRRLKNDARTEGLRVIFLSGAAQSATKVEGLDLGAIDYITKPFNPVRVKGQDLLSFNNLVEAHVLLSLRRAHGSSPQSLRKTLTYIAKEFATKRPLITERLQTDGIGLFVDKFATLINASRKGQMAIREVLSAHVRRLDPRVR